MFQFDGALSTAGLQSVLTTIENQFWWDRFEHQIWTSRVISGAARDSGNTSYTDMLRPGLLLGQIASTGKLIEWTPTATDGSQYIFGVLGYAQKMQRLGANQDRWLGSILLRGAVKANRLLVPGQSSYGISGLSTEWTIRHQMHNRFLFDDMPWGNSLSGWREIRAVTASSLQLTTAENNCLFTTRGAGAGVDFILPTVGPLKHLRFGFFSVADFSMTISSSGSADNIVLGNDAAADSMVFSTATEIIGNHVEIVGDGTSWLLFNHIGREAYTVSPT